MLTALKFVISVLALAGASLAQHGLTIDNRDRERSSTPEAEKIYSSACSVVEREFDIKHPNHHQVRLSTLYTICELRWRHRNSQEEFVEVRTLLFR